MGSRTITFSYQKANVVTSTVGCKIVPKLVGASNELKLLLGVVPTHSKRLRLIVSGNLYNRATPLGKIMIIPKVVDHPAGNESFLSIMRVSSYLIIPEA